MKNRIVWVLVSLFMLSFVGATNPPTITVQPQSPTLLVGQPAMFSVSAAGEDLTYQWQRNGQDIAGATQQTFVLPTVAIVDKGSLFRVKVTNDKGSVTSCIALLTVIESGTPSTSPPVCPEAAQPTGNGGGGGCGGGGGGGGGSGSGPGSSSGDPGDPQNPELLDESSPYPVTRWKGSVKATHVFNNATSGDGFTMVVEGDATFESSPGEIGLYPTSIVATEGSLHLTREGVGGACSDTVTATGQIDRNSGQLDFQPDPPPPQHMTQLAYTGGGSATMTGTQVRSCPQGGGGTNAWSERPKWMFVIDARTSPDLMVISGTYVHDASIPGVTSRTTYEWHLVKQR